jgi:proteasome regulatory subunit
MILKIHTRKMNLKGVNFQDLAKKTEGFSGAHIKALVTEAGIKALRGREENITQSHFNNALTDIIDKEHSVKDYIYS